MYFEQRQSVVQSVPAYVVPVYSRAIGSWQFSIGRKAFGRNELEGHYDKKSSVWQTKINRLGFETAYVSLLRKVLWQKCYAQHAVDLRVLDVGTGTGAMASAFCKLWPRRFRLDGIDISAEMLRRAEGHLRSHDVDLTLSRADLEALPYPDNTFDVVLVAHVLEHQVAPDRAIAELYRVLKPGGLLIACMTRRSSFGAYVQLMWRTHQVEMKSAKDWFRRCGFRSVRAVPLSKQSIARRFSIGYVGRKPDGQACE